MARYRTHSIDKIWHAAQAGSSVQQDNVLVLEDYLKTTTLVCARTIDPDRARVETWLFAFAHLNYAARGQ
jgi:hypothetical protein